MKNIQAICALVFALMVATEVVAQNIPTGTGGIPGGFNVPGGMPTGGMPGMPGMPGMSGMPGGAGGIPQAGGFNIPQTGGFGVPQAGATGGIPQNVPNPAGKTGVKF